MAQRTHTHTRHEDRNELIQELREHIRDLRSVLEQRWHPHGATLTGHTNHEASRRPSHTKPHTSRTMK